MNGSDRPERIAFLGSYLPRLCGIATFTHDLCEAVSGRVPGGNCYVVGVSDRPEGYDYPSHVRCEVMDKDLNSYRRAAVYLNFNNADLLSVQHEFGIYGGPAGSHLLELLRHVRMPVVTTLHTILHQPDAQQRRVMDELIFRSDRLVVMAEKGAQLLKEIYRAPAAKIDVILHGIPNIPFEDSRPCKARLGVQNRTVLFTFGLLGRGKGIEFVIEALQQIVRTHPDVVYLILGATHPNLVAHEGEAYRDELKKLAAARGVAENVIFFDRFVSLKELTEFIGATDIYVTPYRNEAQITSGTLAYVFGSGKAVVSTPFWHAQELLADGRGILVPFDDPRAIATGVSAYLDDPERMLRTRREAYRLGRDMIWPTVAKKYMATFERARTDRKSEIRVPSIRWTRTHRPGDIPQLRLDHVARMTDRTGIFQHAIFSVPSPQHGYCVDDNARALILCNTLDEACSRELRNLINELAASYLKFLVSAMNPYSGRFRNFMSCDKRWLEDQGSEDSHARALWALGHAAARSGGEGARTLAARFFALGLGTVDSFTSPRAWAFTLLGIDEFLRAFPHCGTTRTARESLTEKLVRLWRNCATESWPWFESSATYDNARLCQAMIVSGKGLPDAGVTEIGIKSLGWLASLQTGQSGQFRPIGSNGFYRKDGARADFDQQPVEAQAMVSACLEAARVTGDSRWMVEARRAFDWFLGGNDLGRSLYDHSTGGCRDGLHKDRVNQNQGAESSLAFQLSRAELSQASHALVAAL